MQDVYSAWLKSACTLKPDATRMCNVMWSSLLGNFPRWDRFDCLSRHPGGHVEPDSLIMNHVLQTDSTTLNTLSVPRFVLDVKCAHAQSHTLLTHDINFSGWVFSRVCMKDLPNLVRLEPGEALEPWAEARCNPCIRCHIQQLPLRGEFTEAKHLEGCKQRGEFSVQLLFLSWSTKKGVNVCLLNPFDSSKTLIYCLKRIHGCNGYFLWFSIECIFNLNHSHHFVWWEVRFIRREVSRFAPFWHSKWSTVDTGGRRVL